MNKVVAVTGASGYLGSRLCRGFVAAGGRAVRMSRGSAEARFTLAAGAPDGLFRRHRVLALVHCAWDFTASRRADVAAHNVLGSIRLMEQARAEGVETIVFVSTISAFPGCRSEYGRAKLTVEAAARRLGALVVRPGLVFGDRPGGMIGALSAAVRTSPVVPLVGTGRQLLYPAHEDDVVALVRRLVVRPDLVEPGRPVIAAHEHGWTLRRILEGLAARQGRAIRLVPVPWRAVWLPLRTAELLGLHPPFRSDSVVSLVNQPRSPDFAPTRAAGVAFRDFARPAPGVSHVG
ncbi:NAD-dependent epimerase/dehydratase family protein [Dactylosporangium aurantiacum]|uniref:NAD-dependent epimerase/dehydratase family protein n=1 Tax=Dactylosporangium aurantiacum TaxID=35754 RepID=A0A9Q9ILI7_9ACTN|nr:NAD-dependent epimerase/dehydratase family protein [Dactylosporangium aurantiacum]MDG6110130.1 NAD-dependent epimerase/dehydratase family protein [Dactylosporangium aurantiacum]UWZ57876.1 NAD-dependent epimerase/dehydratase family protein [Dactylosporangium aurantiacum]